jgi:hypothetical protein
VKQLFEFGLRPLREPPFSELTGLTAEVISDEPNYPYPCPYPYPYPYP